MTVQNHSVTCRRCTRKDTFRNVTITTARAKMLDRGWYKMQAGRYKGQWLCPEHVKQEENRRLHGED